MVRRKKEASGAIGYVFLFMLVLIMAAVVMYLASVAKLMTHQHHIDDSLADSVLASLVADDEYYFETLELTGEPVIRLADTDESFAVYSDCMSDAISGTTGFYYNYKPQVYITYEVEGNIVTVTTYNSYGSRTVSSGRLGRVKTPKGEVVSETSAYARVQFDIKSIIDGSFMTKTKDIYCTLRVND